MSLTPGSGSKGSFRWRDLPKLLRLGRSLRRAYRDQADVDDEGDPAIVLLDDRSSAIADRAEELAGEGREDDAAIAELRALGGRHELDMRVAALSFRQDGRHRESSVAELAIRLLEAAISGEPLQPPASS